MNVRYGFFGKKYHYEQIQLTVASDGSVAATDFVLDEAYQNEPAMMVVFPGLTTTSITYVITYTAATPKVTISVADGAQDLDEVASRVINAILILHEKL